MKNLLKTDCFLEKWLKDKSRDLSGNPILIEKTLHAFALLGSLVQLEDNFVFKGGTSLLLHIPKIKRLSIDIDIIFGGDIEKFVEKLSQIPDDFPFIRFEENERGNRGLPNRRHFKFFYLSKISNREESVLLDVVLDTPPVSFIETKLIKGDFVEVANDISVKVPSVEGLFGDKLTAFAPHTIGVPFVTSKGKSMTMQVVKQLFDVGELFNTATNFENIKAAFKETYKKENEYHPEKFTEEEVLNDIIEISLNICQIRLKGFKNTNDTDCIEDGVRRIASHLLRERFRINNEAKIAASKVFCIANGIKNNKTFDLNNGKYNSSTIEQIKNITLLSPYEKLNRLKPILPEAFYYIWQGVKE